MSIVRNFNLYLNAGNGSVPYINVNQYDQGEQWVFTLYKEDGTKYTPSTGAIVGIKADNRGIINTGTVDADGHVVINETQQMTAAAGIAIFELLIDGDSHGTANFLVNVEQRPGDNADLSDSDLSLIQQAVDSAEVIVEVIGDSDPSEVIGEHVDDWLDAHPEATTTVLDGAITAPKINNSLWDKILVNEEVSGNPASFDDGADDVPVSSLKVALEPVQLGSGDPSPSNVRPISGQSTVTVTRTGKNLLQLTATSRTLNGVTFTVNADGTITANGTCTAAAWYQIATVTLNGEYIISGCPSGGSSTTYSIVSQGVQTVTEYGDGATVNYDGTNKIVYIYIYNGATVNNIVFKPMIRNTGTDTTFEPYTSTSYPYTLGQNVYGGSVDLATGVLTVDRASITYDGSSDESWIKGSTADAYENDWTRFVIALSDAKVSAQPITNWLQGKSDDTGTTYAPRQAHIGPSSASYAIDLVVPKSYATNASEWKTYLASNPLQVVYELATPTTVQLTPTEVKTLLGYNNISSSGTVDVIYHADTKLYVDKMTAVDNNIIAPTEADFVATRNYTVNDLVIVADTLYKVTANIASGSAITPNSNVQQTTLSALIKALS
ncbi:MAG: hypothetical protein IKE74_08860 [Mogibacterium sp.]|nr:hypothetical protein [Mogibacterium sp.]